MVLSLKLMTLVCVTGVRFIY